MAGRDVVEAAEESDAAVSPSDESEVQAAKASPAQSGGLNGGRKKPASA